MAHGTLPTGNYNSFMFCIEMNKNGLCWEEVVRSMLLPATCLVGPECESGILIPNPIYPCFSLSRRFDLPLKPSLHVESSCSDDNSRVSPPIEAMRIHSRLKFL